MPSIMWTLGAMGRSDLAAILDILALLPEVLFGDTAGHEPGTMADDSLIVTVPPDMISWIPLHN
jgi:hypothetical protein